LMGRVNCRLASLLATALLCVAATGLADSGDALHARQIFLQPWQSHADKQDQIKRYFARMHTQYTHLFLQWSRYGDSEFWPEDGSGWLKKALPRYSQTKLIHGLYLGVDYFDALKLNDQDLEVYLTRARALSLSEAKKLQLQSPLPIAGWYLPEEIDDLNWKTPRRQAILIQHLRSMSADLAQLKPKVPVYVSAFFGGYTPPVQFAEQLRLIQQQTDIVWLIQDGQGVRREPAPDTRLYLSTIAKILPAQAWKSITEEFTEQQSKSGALFCTAMLDEHLRRHALWRTSTGRSPEIAFALNHTESDLFGASKGCSPWGEFPVGRSNGR
jgi:hypothetical protein